jgi:hypothetical protein
MGKRVYFSLENTADSAGAVKEELVQMPFRLYGYGKKPTSPGKGRERMSVDRPSENLVHHLCMVKKQTICSTTQDKITLLAEISAPGRPSASNI